VGEHRNIIVSIATSVDGFIARLDGSYDWLDRPRPPGNYGFSEFMDSIDTILWGRKTYDQAATTFKGKSLGTGPNVKNYVFAHDPPKSAPPSVEFVKEPVEEFARRLRAQPGKNIWIMGGGQIIASFLDAGLIDEFRIHVIPRLIGEGIPLLHPRHRFVQLELREAINFPDGVVKLVYGVLNESPKLDSPKP
jgi:dihydrofolate reductase